MRWFVLGVLSVLFLTLLDQEDHADAGSAHPNVLFISIDDLNDWTGGLGGHPQATTPNIDRLAERGVLFTNAHCPAPMCNPSRAAVLTGVAPHRSGLYRNTVPFREALPDVVTLPEHFRANGYRIYRAGKLFHNEFPDTETWEWTFPDPPRHRPADPKPKNPPLNGIAAKALFDWGPLAARAAEMSDTQIAESVGRLLGAEHDEPFFIACGFYRPHLPWYVPRAYFRPFPLDSIQLPAFQEDDLADVPPIGRRLAKGNGLHAKVLEKEQWQHAVRAYLASSAFVDEQVGKVIAALDAGPNADDTLVVLWSDHGFHHGQKEHWGKEALWEVATRVPVIIVAPGARPGGRAGAPVNLMDLYPTLTELCGLPSPDSADAESLVPLLVDPSASRARPALMTFGRGNHALRSERWRYIRYADGTEELYDHENDPHEWHNLAGDPAHAATKAELAPWFPATDAPERRAKSQRGWRNTDVRPDRNR